MGQVGTAQQPTLSISGRVPKEISPPKKPIPHTAHVQNPQTPKEQTPSLGWSKLPSAGTPAWLPRTPEGQAAPAATAYPGEGDVLFQHRVHHGHRGGGGVGI